MYETIEIFGKCTESKQKAWYQQYVKGAVD